MHFYAFRPHPKFPIYDRTFATREAAERWIDQEPGRFVMVDCLPQHYWY